MIAIQDERQQIDGGQAGIVTDGQRSIMEHTTLVFNMSTDIELFNYWCGYLKTFMQTYKTHSSSINKDELILHVTCQRWGDFFQNTFSIHIVIIIMHIVLRACILSREGHFTMRVQPIFFIFATTVMRAVYILLPHRFRWHTYSLQKRDNARETIIILWKPVRDISTAAFGAGSHTHSPRDDAR